MKVRPMVIETVDEAIGRAHRDDPVVGATGGPAGNARLTGWTGALLLALLAVEGVTLLDIRGLITWHLVVGILLVPPALLKTATTGWRIARYYTGNRAYRHAGPPPLLLRLLGPLVVVFTLAVLGSGLVLVVIGPAASRRPLLGLPGRSLDAVMIHKATFVVWLVVTALHVLGRAVPALRLTLRSAARGVPGRPWRVATLLLTAACAVAGAVVVLGAVGPWQFQPEHFARHAHHTAHR
jgi:hypothetical protein